MGRTRAGPERRPALPLGVQACPFVGDYRGPGLAGGFWLGGSRVLPYTPKGLTLPSWRTETSPGPGGVVGRADERRSGGREEGTLPRVGVSDAGAVPFSRSFPIGPGHPPGGALL